MKNNQSKDHLVWIDLEMTGLDPEKETIIEIATLITNNKLKVVAEGPDLVIRQPLKYLKAMDAWNQKHHSESGLLDAVKKSKISLKKAEQLTLHFIKEYCFPGKSPLCGNSIHHDRRFLVKHMPRLSEYLHYRHIDVSTVKNLVQLWYPKNKKPPKKKNCHRSLSDIRESIEELKFYQEHYFVKR